MNHSRATTLLLSATLFAGCAPKTETTLPPAPPDPTTQPTGIQSPDARERIKELVARADEYAAGAAKLPGRNAAEDRDQVVKQFELLSLILPTISGPEMTGNFRQELRIIDSTRAQLQTGSADLAMEPTVDTGLRAAQRALAALAARSFTDLPDVGKAVEAMKAKNEELDGVSGALHRLVASQSIQASAQAISQMSKALDDKLNEPKKDPNVAPKPATGT